jgi:preprotein translocase subunit SecE
MPQKESSDSTKTTVRRIKATDDTPKKVKKTNEKVAAKTAKVVKSDKKRSRNPFRALGGYFKGAWQELKMVRWPTRAATWSMTLAVLAFTGIFVIVILLLDAGFNWVFEQILK